MGKAADSEVLDRKLRPIYEALDSQNYKVGRRGADPLKFPTAPPSTPCTCPPPKTLLTGLPPQPQGALKLINAALEKHKDNDTLRSLKAIALQRSGKTDEATKARPA